MNPVYPKKLLSFLLLALLLITACKPGGDDVNNLEDNPTEITPTPVTITLKGKVMSYYNLDIAGATVRAGNQTTTTDANGLFTFKNITMDRFSSLITVEKANYVKSYKVFSCKQGSTAYVEVKMYTNGSSLTINAATGGFVALPDGSRVTLPANAVVLKSTGAAYTGTIKVRAINYDPAFPSIAELGPGSFQAIDANGNKVLLRSYTMMYVELETSTGQPLQLAAGKTARLKFGISPSMDLFDNPPATIPLWYLDETTGLWRQEGSATKVGSYYEGDVSHFSFWNCDMPEEMVYLQMTLNGPNGPMPYTKVAIHLDNSATASYGFTDSTGYVSGFVFKNKPLWLVVLNTCDEDAFTKNIGSFSENTNLGVIQVTPAPDLKLQITGKVVNCNDQPVSKGNVFIKYEGREYNVPIQSNGTFSTNFTRCATASTVVEMLTVDEEGQYQSTPYSFTITGNTLNAGTLKACAFSLISTIDYTLDGVPYHLSSIAGDTVEYSANLDPNGDGFRYIYGFKKNGNGEGILFRVSGNNPYPVGSPFHDIHDLSSIEVTPMFNSFAHMDYHDLKITIPNFVPLQPVGTFIEGSFDVEVREITAGNPSQSIFHRIKGTFRIKRID